MMFGATLQPDTHMFNRVLSVIDQGPEAIVEFFGKDIYLADLYRYGIVTDEDLQNDDETDDEAAQVDDYDDFIPLLDFDEEDEAASEFDFEDVVKPQKLVIQCNYLEEHATAFNDDECIICCDAMCNTKLGCGHEFCMTCVQRSIKSVLEDHRKTANCPMCREEIVKVASGNRGDLDKLANLLA
jgi:hypothetical protein